MAAHSKNLGCFRYKVAIDAGALVSRAEAARAQALPLIGQHIRAQSTAIAPLRDGGLIGSVRVELGDDKVTVVYEKVYANYQHEGEKFNHPNGRQAKYLESVMEDHTTEQATQQIFLDKLRGNL